MLRKSILTFMFFVSVSASYASNNGEVSPEMQCISRCVGALGWEEVEFCVDLCTS